MSTKFIVAFVVGIILLLVTWGENGLSEFYSGHLAVRLDQTLRSNEETTSVTMTEEEEQWFRSSGSHGQEAVQEQSSIQSSSNETHSESNRTTETENTEIPLEINKTVKTETLTPHKDKPVHYSARVNRPRPKNGVYYPVLAPNYPMGGTCNILLGLALSFAKAHEHNSSLIIWGPWRKAFNLLDHDYIRKNYPVHFTVQAEEPPRSIPGYDGSDGVLCGQGYAYNFTRVAMRPKPEFRKQAEEQILALRNKSNTVIAVHLRYFETLCRDGKLTKLEWLQWETCHKLNRDTFVLDLGRICDYQLDKVLLDQIETEWPETKQIRNFSMFVSTDQQRPDYLARFFDQNYTQQFRVVAASNSPPQTNMLVDMWASTLVDYYVANPRSSCEPIIVQWRAQEGKQKDGGVHPRACFSGFANYEQKLNLDRSQYPTFC